MWTANTNWHTKFTEALAQCVWKSQSWWSPAGRYKTLLGHKYWVIVSLITMWNTNTHSANIQIKFKYPFYFEFPFVNLSIKAMIFTRNVIGFVFILTFWPMSKLHLYFYPSLSCSSEMDIGKFDKLLINKP